MNKDLQKAVNMLMARRHFDILKESYAILIETKNPKTFFGRYQDILFSSKQINQLLGETNEMTEFVYRINRDKEKLINDFFDRCYVSGTLQEKSGEIKKYRNDMTDANWKYLLSLLEAR